MAQTRFDALGFVIRWLVALVLVFATFNPTDYCYYHWVTPYDETNLPLKVLTGVVLAILYVIFVRATWRSIGPVGLVLAASFFGAIIWVLIDFGLLDPAQSTVMTYVLLVISATILAVGISWSHIRRRATGQADIDDVDE